MRYAALTLVALVSCSHAAQPPLAPQERQSGSGGAVESAGCQDAAARELELRRALLIAGPVMAEWRWYKTHPGQQPAGELDELDRAISDATK